jgi:hypothetical protein
MEDGMKKRYRKCTAFIIILFSRGIALMGMDYVDLGVIPVGFPRLECRIHLPYYKPEGITQVPSRSFNALVIHKLLVDGMQIIPQTRCFAADESKTRIYIDRTDSEEEYRTLELSWSWSSYDFTKETIQRGLSYISTAGGPSFPADQYRIPYGSKKISMTYSIRFLVFGEGYKLLDTLESEEYEAAWELEWRLPPNSSDD